MSEGVESTHCISCSVWNKRQGRGQDCCWQHQQHCSQRVCLSDGLISRLMIGQIHYRMCPILGEGGRKSLS